MANFVEQATLQLNDQASKKIRVINAELNKLMATANRMRSLRVDIKGLSESTAKTRSLTNQMTKLAAASRAAGAVGSKQLGAQNVVNLNSTAIDRAIAKAVRLNTLLKQPHRVNLAATAAQGGGRGSRGGGLGIRSGAGVGIPGLPVGVGVSGGGLSIATAAIAVSTLTVTAKNLIVQGIAREMQQQQLQATTTDAQMREFLRTGRPAATQNVPVTDLQRQNLAAGFLADANGNVEASLKLADRTIQSAQDLARTRGITFQAALEQTGNSLVKGVGQVTTDMIDASGNLTQRARDSFDTFDKVLAVQPTLAPRDVSQFTAGLGPNRTTVDQDTLFRGLFLTGDFGTKLGNQVRQAILGLQGEQRAKSNAALQGIGINQNDERIGTDFNAWLNDTLFPKIEQRVDKSFADRGITPTTEQRNAAVFKELTPILGRQTAQNIVAEFFGSGGALDRARTQAEAQFSEAAAERVAALNSWTNKLEVAGIRLTDLFQRVGDSLGNTLAPAFDAIASGASKLQSFITDPATGEVDPVKAATTAAGGAGLALFAGKKAFDFFNPLNASAVALDGSAAALTRAAIALGGSGVGGAAGAAGAAGAGAAASKMPLWQRVGGMIALGFAAAEGTKTLFKPESDMAKQNRIGPGGVDDALRAAINWARGNDGTQAGRLQQGGEMRGDRERPADLAKAAATAASIVIDQKAATLANRDAGISTSSPIPVTITGATGPMSGIKAQAMQTQTPGALQQTTQTFLTGMDTNFAEAQTRFATTFQTGGAEAGTAVQNGVTMGGTSAAAAMAASIDAAGQRAAAAMAAAINGASARVQVTTAGAGNTLPNAQPANTGALQPIE
jgi:hypothetical protein